MVKTIDTPQLDDHLEQQVTGLVTCWLIEREDGEEFRFTDATEDLVIDGDTYSSVGAYKRTAIESTSSLSVDNLEIVGIAGDLSLPEEDLRNGLFDNARISVFMAAWSATVPGKIRLRRGFFGEVQSIPNGTFQVELRGLMQRLGYNYMDIFSPTCLYDLGEPACSIVIRPEDVKRSTSYNTGDTVLAAKNNAPSLGTRYNFEIPDRGFEDLLLSGFATSPYWFNTGATDMIANGSVSFEGSASLSSDGGAGEVRQVIEIRDVCDVPNEALIKKQATINLQGYWRTDGGSARVRMEFKDEDFTTIDYSQAARSTQGHGYTNEIISGEFTTTFWIKPDNDDLGGITGGLGAVGGADICYINGTIYLQSTGDNPTNIYLQTPANDGITEVFHGEWNHVAVVRDATMTYIYINFELMASTDFVWTDYAFQDLFQNTLGSVTPFDNGALDDFRVYDVAKSIGEIYAESKNEPTLPDANLRRWFSFNDGTINDQTGNDAVTPGAGTGVTYEESGAPINGDGSISATWNSGAQSPGTTWQRFESGAITIPPHAKQVRLRFTAESPEAYFDALSATVYDERTNDSNFLPSDVDNLYWECTNNGGVTSATYPSTFTGGVGSTASDGGVVWTARNPWLRSGRVREASDLRNFTSDVSDSRDVDAWFNGGSVIWITGLNAGAVMEVKKWRTSSGTVELFLSMSNEIRAGDEFYIYPGCDKSRVNCAAVFRNVKNFFGFPDVPGQDELFRYPDSKA